jgi:hypothetical protein
MLARRFAFALRCVGGVLESTRYINLFARLRIVPFSQAIGCGAQLELDPSKCEKGQTSSNFCGEYKLYACVGH